ncbi:TonB-dependent receptor plug domain-containing protein [Aurantiacibacter poecillastricola]|uniref:TonB-dependent receptor plug domain-containing protein n=1 Tax=Aurantiacibacter poecillastricola TaxID=3064385 RepID=UPI00273E7487|nr:TonB-dependent receptor [Aurantiacibacter sp. 219JJ12-13]MDP5261237.1 TonB-dependent receptor [Aurantiacibacter sp. 219JJ12-13]
MRTYKASLLAAAALCCPSLALAQTAPDIEPDNGTQAAPEEEAIVVVGKLTDSTLDREDIEITQANDLGDLFRRTPSVSVGGAIGIAEKIYVRGLEDAQLNISIDGAQIQGTLFHHVGRVSVEPELLERVDVQTGAGEATSGFGAIGGAIRFRTRDAVDLLEPGRNVGGIARAGWFSNDGYKLSGTAYGRLAGDVGIIASYVHQNRDPYEDGDGNLVAGSGAEQNVGFVKIGGDIGIGHGFSLSYEQRDEEGEFGARPNWPVLEGDTLFPAEAQRRTVIGNYRYDSGGILGVELTGYWSRAEFELDRFDRWGLYGAEIENWGADARLNLAAGMHDVTLGMEYRNDHVSSAYLDDPAMWQPWAWDPAVGRFTEEGELFGLYLQDRWQVFDQLLVSFGARYDNYSLDLVTYGGGVDSDGISFNIGADYEIVPGLTANVGYAEAFRGKEIGDAFTLEHNAAWAILQPGLQPETVKNIEAGLAYDADGFYASAAFYRMEIENVVLDQLYRDRTATPLQNNTYYENVGEFRSEGFELRGGYRSGAFGISGFYNYYNPELNGLPVNGYEHLALGNTLGDQWNISATFDPTPSLGFEASLTRFERVEDLETLFRDVELGYVPETQFIDKPGYTTVDLFARWQPFGTDRFELLAAVYNLFDETYLAHASVGDYTAIPDYEIVRGVNEPGRNIRLSASVRF